MTRLFMSVHLSESPDITGAISIPMCLPGHIAQQSMLGKILARFGPLILLFVYGPAQEVTLSCRREGNFLLTASMAEVTQRPSFALKRHLSTH